MWSTSPKRHRRKLTDRQVNAIRFSAQMLNGSVHARARVIRAALALDAISISAIADVINNHTFVEVR